MFNFADVHAPESFEICSLKRSSEFTSTRFTDFSELLIQEQYENFKQDCLINKTILQSKLDRINKYFAKKYENFPGISFDEFIMQTENE